MRPPPDQPNDWQATWNAREAALVSVLGKTNGHVLHALKPFNLGGQADVLIFPNHIDGQIAATCELLGESSQKQNSLGSYELAVAQRDAHKWGPQIISHLARYTCEAKLEPGHTMALGQNFPKGSTMAGLLFEDFARFEFAGAKAGLLLCIAITQDEMDACRASKREAVIGAMKNAGVYPYSDLFRLSVLRATGRGA